jgi:peptidoglycan/xylan/chitin deacetylase (PgdA/CDA1 family)
MGILSWAGHARRQVLCSLYRRPLALGNLGPIVTFTFDDFPRSALTNGAAIVERFGGRATYYVAMGLMGTRNNLGEQFAFTDLSSLVDRGHELANHSFSHLSARRTSVEEFLRDVDYCDKSIRECISAVPSDNFAYPYGETTLVAKRLVGTRMRSCRGTCAGLNGPNVDLNLLRANPLYGSIDRLRSAKQLIEENEYRRSWLIFYSHDVALNPSPFGCTPALLEEVASFAFKRGTRMMTVTEVLAERGAAG